MTEEINSRPELRPKWLTIVGDLEVLIAVAVFVYSLTIQVRPGTQWQSMIHIFSAIGIGAGFALGGLRFSDRNVRPIAWCVTTAYVLLIAALIITSFIPRKSLERFWSSISPVL